MRDERRASMRRCDDSHELTQALAAARPRRAMPRRATTGSRRSGCAAEQRLAGRPREPRRGPGACCDELAGAGRPARARARGDRCADRRTASAHRPARPMRAGRDRADERAWRSSRCSLARRCAGGRAGAAAALAWIGRRGLPGCRKAGAADPAPRSPRGALRSMRARGWCCVRRDDGRASAGRRTRRRQPGREPLPAASSADGATCMSRAADSRRGAAAGGASGCSSPGACRGPVDQRRSRPGGRHASPVRSSGSSCWSRCSAWRRRSW